MEENPGSSPGSLNFTGLIDKALPFGARSSSSNEIVLMLASTICIETTIILCLVSTDAFTNFIIKIGIDTFASANLIICFLL